MIPYILHVALLISVCLCFYKLLLRKETFYRLNRFVLLSIVCLSFIVPLVPVPQEWAFAREQQTVFISKPVIKNDASSTNPSNTKSDKQNIQQNTNLQPAVPAQTTVNAAFSWSQILSVTFFLYWIGVLIFGANFLLQLIVLIYPVMVETGYKRWPL
jgi:beta-lactamase regulating signal transducer with metallopeptidase domain